MCTIQPRPLTGRAEKLYYLIIILIQVILSVSNGASVKSVKPSNATLLSQFVRTRSLTYGSSERPVLDPAHKVTVYYGIRLIQVDVEEKANILHTSVWVRQQWVDEYLRWDPADFGGLSRVSVPSDWIWTPDITLVNTADTDISERSAKVVIGQNGNIFWLQQQKFKSACLIDVTNYPYDEQICDLWFQSLSNPSPQMDPQPYTPTAFDLDTYLSGFKRADEWEILETNATRIARPRDVGEMLMFSRRTTLRFTLFLRRRAGFTAYLLCVPCVVLGCMSILVFVLPPERPDRHAIGTALLGSFMLLLLLLVNTAPPSAASVPKLGLLYAANIGVIVLSLCLSGIVVNISKQAERGTVMPAWMEKVFVHWMAIVCLVKRPNHNKPREDRLLEGKQQLPLGDDYSNKCSLQSPVEGSSVQESSNVIVNHLEYMKCQMKTIENALWSMSQQLSKKSPPPNPNFAKWKTMAAVLDRFFLVFQVCLICLSVGLLLPQSM